jgi:cob(I)alamin adenosyltransferase
MRVYTGGGDRGRTSLFSGERVVKNDRRLEASGALDEVNSIIGAVVSVLPPQTPDKTRRTLERIQGDLFHLGARLATLPGSPLASAIRRIRSEDSRYLEAAMDQMDAELPELRQFILPGGHPAAAWAHVARSASRRAERQTVRLAEENELESVELLEGEIVFLNRLSDYFFVLARWLNRLTGVADRTWRK